MNVGQFESRSISSLCSLLGYSRQAFYRFRQDAEREALQHDLILQKVLSIRKPLKRVGTRKLLFMMQDFMQQHHIQIGRDSLFDLLASHRLLIRRRIRRIPVTTFSDHWMHKYPNLIIGYIPVGPNQLWVSDITYICLINDFAYLSLITDAYSRKIVGFHVSDDMRATSAIVALQKAFDQKPTDAIVIHHSDRGIQYCSNDYVALLKQHHARISMTQNGDPYENALAERVNGILKTELISETYPDLRQAMQHIARCITIYNYRRIHSSLNWQIPDDVHQQKGPQVKKWKNYYKKKEVEMAAP